MRFLLSLLCLLTLQSEAAQPFQLHRRLAFQSGGGGAPPSPIVVTDKSTTNTTTGATSYVTATNYTIAANALALAFVVNSKASAPDTPTFSGNGMTWVQVKTVTCNTIAAPTQRLTVFRGMTNATSTSTAGTASFGGATQTGCAIKVFEFTNVNTGGTNGSQAVAQCQTGNADTTANETITMQALDSSALNTVIACAVNSVASGSDESPEAGWTEADELTYSTPSTGTTVDYRNQTTDNTVAITCTSRNWAIAAVEVRAATVSPAWLISEGFEGTGTPSGWTTVGSGDNFDYTTTVLEGSESLGIEGTVDSAAQFTFAGQTDCYVYFQFRMTALPAVSINGLAITDSGGSAICYVGVNSSGTATINVVGGGNATSVGAMSSGTKYHCWLHFFPATTCIASFAFSTDGIEPLSGNNFVTRSDNKTTTPAGGSLENYSVGNTWIFDHVRALNTDPSDLPP